MCKAIYNLVIGVYYLLIKVASPFNKKAYDFVHGRKRLVDRILEDLDKTCPKSGGRRNIIWFHCASVGEFEQARPLIDKIKAYPTNNYRILLTFFSPSGYNLRKNYKNADWVYYLPVDYPGTVRRFVDTVMPEMMIFVKYEYWLNLLDCLHRKEIPTYVVSAIFRPGNLFFKFYASFYRKYLRLFNTIFVQDKFSERTLAKKAGITNVCIAGDTRFDRVYEISENHKAQNAIVEVFSRGRITWVAGSTWGPDEERIAKSLWDIMKNDSRYAETRLVLVPHEVDHSRIHEVEEIFSKFRTVKYSECILHPIEEIEENLKKAQVLIIDTIGLLTSIYAYGRFAYIGGGFGVGIHNILEAACYQLPVIIGPNYHKYQEAVDMINLEAAVSYKRSSQLNKILSYWLSDESDNYMKSQGETAFKYITGNLGASDIILKELGFTIDKI